MLQSGGTLSMLLREHAAATTFAIATHVYKPKEAAAHIRPDLPTCISACLLLPALASCCFHAIGPALLALAFGPWRISGTT